MNMITHQTPGIDGQSFIGNTIIQTVDYNLSVFWCAKHVYPIYHRAGDKMDCLLISNFVSRSCQDNKIVRRSIRKWDMIRSL